MHVWTRDRPRMLSLWMRRGGRDGGERYLTDAPYANVATADCRSSAVCVGVVVNVLGRGLAVMMVSKIKRHAQGQIEYQDRGWSLVKGIGVRLLRAGRASERHGSPTAESVWAS